MIEVNNELITSMKKFKETFGDIVPLRELPQNISNKDLIDAIDISIKENYNFLPEKFRFKELEENKDISM